MAKKKKRARTPKGALPHSELVALHVNAFKALGNVEARSRYMLDGLLGNVRSLLGAKRGKDWRAHNVKCLLEAWDSTGGSSS